MKYLIIVIAGIAGIAVGSYLGRRRAAAAKSLGAANGEAKTKEDKEKKEENLEKLRLTFAEKIRLANADVEELLGVSDATATRYLDELEKEKFIRQVGTTGRHVYYEKI